MESILNLTQEIDVFDAEEPYLSFSGAGKPTISIKGTKDGQRFEFTAFFKREYRDELIKQILIIAGELK